MPINAMLPRVRPINGWAIVSAFFVVAGIVNLITEGAEGPWWVLLLFAIPALAGALRHKRATAATRIDKLSVGLALGLGLWSGYRATQINGYIAGYAFGGAFFFAVCLVVIACAAFFLSATRREAAVFGLAGVGHLAAFYLAVAVATWTGNNRWEEIEQRDRQVWGTRR